MKTIRDRILAADETLRARDILLPEATRCLPDVIARPFGAMTIKWLDNRTWGQSFELGAKVVHLGNRRGDHLATHPHLYGVEAKEAERILRAQVGGTLVHELGHALVESLPKEVQQTVLSVADSLCRRDGMSTYGYNMPHKPNDPYAQAHECLAEAFRYWCHADERLRQQYPGWHQLVDAMMEHVAQPPWGQSPSARSNPKEASESSKGPSPQLYERFAAKGAPRPGERGYREVSPERAAAEETASTAMRYWTDAEMGWHVLHASRMAHDVAHLFEDEAPDEPMLEAEDLPGLLGQPLWSPMQAGGFIEAVGVMKEQFMPDALVREVLADAVHPAGKLRLVNVPKDEAVAFINRHHSQMPIANPRGLMYAIGAMKGSRLVAVATAGSPTGRWGSDRVEVRNILELTRIASDGTTLGASSFLASRLIDLLDKSKRGDETGPALFVTYSLTSEDGTTYRALRDKGLRPVALIRGKSAGGGGARAGNQLGYAEPDKIRWEAGAAALPAQWDLLTAPSGT
jgi:hypothetical protein